MNFFDHKDLENHLLQLCPKVVKHSVYKRTLVSNTREERGRGCSELMSWKIYLGLKRQEVTGNNLPSSLNVIWVF